MFPMEFEALGIKESVTTFFPKSSRRVMPSSEREDTTNIDVTRQANDEF